VLLWNARKPDRPVELSAHDSDITGLAFNYDGTHLAGTSQDGTTHIWSLADTAHPIVLHSQQDNVPVGNLNVTFSPDGQRLITVGADTKIRVWRTDRANQTPLVLDGFSAPVEAIAPLDDNRFVTPHADGTISIWSCPAYDPITQLLAEVDRYTTRELTSKERRTYLPD
jgi:WD40 repeat protein